MAGPTFAAPAFFHLRFEHVPCPAEKFVAEDPYVSNSIVVGHSITEWTVVVGGN